MVSKLPMVFTFCPLLSVSSRPCGLSVRFARNLRRLVASARLNGVRALSRLSTLQAAAWAKQRRGTQRLPGPRESEQNQSRRLKTRGLMKVSKGQLTNTAEIRLLHPLHGSGSTISIPGFDCNSVGWFGGSSLLRVTRLCFERETNRKITIYIHIYVYIYIYIYMYWG